MMKTILIKTRWTVALVVMAIVAVGQVYGQGTLTDSLVLRNPTNGRTTLIGNTAVASASPWHLTFPLSQGTSNSLLTSTVVGSNSTLSWLAPGANNSVLTITAGVPTWAVGGANWLLLGNPGTSDVTNFLGTTDAVDLILRSNNEIRMRVNQEFNASVDIVRPTTVDGAYGTLSLGINFQNTGYAVAQNNTRALANTVDFGTGGPGGPAQTGTLFGNWTRFLMLRGAGTTYEDMVGHIFQWRANATTATNSITGYWAERLNTSAVGNTLTTLYQFRAELPGNGTVTELFGFYMGTPSGALNNIAAFNAQNIPTGVGNRYAFRYNGTGANQPFTVGADGSITSGTLTPLANSRMLFTNLPATSGRAVDIDMTATTTSSGLVVRNIGATGSSDAGVLIGTAAAGAGTGIRIAGVAGFNSPSTGIDMTISSTGVIVTPNNTAAGVGIRIGTNAGNRTRIGGEIYSRASGGLAYGIRVDVNSTAAPASLGIGAHLTTSGVTGVIFPLVVSSENNNDVYLGSTVADRPAALTTTLLGTLTQNSTYMFNSRISGSQIFVGSTSGTVSLAAPAVVTTHDYVLPAVQGAVGNALRIQSVAGVSAQLEWAADAPALFARRTADATYATNVLGNDGQLFVALLANDTYEFEAMIAYDGATTDADLQLAFAVPAGAAIRWGITGGNGVSVSPSSIAVSGTAITDIPVNTTTSGNDVMIYVKGLVVMGGTAGNLQLQAATTTAAKTTVLLTNSYLKASKMN